MSQTATREEMMKEAKKRLAKIDTTGRLSRDFRHGKIDVSAICFRNDEDIDAALFPALQERIKFIEEKYNVVAYHVIRSWVDNWEGDYDIIDFILVVVPQKNEWKMDHVHMDEWQIVFVYAYNHSDDRCSEFGDISYDIDEDGILMKI